MKNEWLRGVPAFAGMTGLWTERYHSHESGRRLRNEAFRTSVILIVCCKVIWRTSNRPDVPDRFKNAGLFFGVTSKKRRGFCQVMSQTPQKISATFIDISPCNMMYGAKKFGGADRRVCPCFGLLRQACLRCHSFYCRTYADPTRPPLNQGRREHEDFFPSPDLRGGPGWGA